MVLRPAKAFLCYAWSDQGFVKAVASELGRQFCLYDEYVLKTGDELAKAFREHLDEATVFVLFASRDSLTSEWATFEMDEAEIRHAHGLIARGLVLRFDTSIGISQLPAWLRRTKVGDAVSPKSAARQIRQMLTDVTRQLRYPYFVGRTDELKRIQEALVPLDARTPPRIVHLSGLEGIGRRSVIAEVARNLLHLDHLEIVTVEEGDGPQELAMKIAEFTEPYASNDGFRARVKEIAALAGDKAAARSAADLKVACSQGGMPVLLDAGGILDQRGNTVRFVADLLKLVSQSTETYLTLITRRRLPSDEIPGVGTLPSIGIPPMNYEDVKRLLSVLARKETVAVSPQQITTLAEKVRGYPPAAYFALQFVKTYGVDVLLADNLRIVELSLATYTNYLRWIKLDEFERKILRTLATHSPLPLRVVGEAAKLSAVDTAVRVMRLIDYSVIVLNHDGTYSVAQPLEEAILREFGYLRATEHGQVANALDGYLAMEEQDLQRLTLARVLFRALILSGTAKASERAYALASDWIRMTGDAYHARDFERAAQLGAEAVKLRPESVEAWSFFIRAQIQTERWEEAAGNISRVRQLRDLQEAYFLVGFLDRKRGRFPEALAAFEKAVENGRGGVSVYREMAACLFRLGKLAEAMEKVGEAESYGENRYVADLKVQIAIALRDEDAARDGLARLEKLEDSMFYNHRRSTVEAAFGDMEKAYAAALLAWESGERPPFEVLAQLVICEIDTRRFADAVKDLALLDERYHYTRRDIRTGLRCRLEIERGAVQDALVLWGKLEDKSKPVHQALRRDILIGLLKTNPAEPEKTQYTKELGALMKVLADKRPSFELE